MDNGKAIAAAKEFCEAEKWISVKERLPEESGRYWCFVREQNDLGLSTFQWNCNYDDVDKTFSDNFQSMSVTHWTSLMPVPNRLTDINVGQSQSTVSSAGKEVQQTDNNVGLISTVSKVKTLQECKDEIANRYHFDTWVIMDKAMESHVNLFHEVNDYDRWNDLLDEAAEMYANQFKATPAKVISEEALEEVFFKIAHAQDAKGNYLIDYGTFNEWYREQLNQKP